MVGWGLRRAPRSSALIAFALSPASSANSSCERVAASRWRLSSAPKAPHADVSMMKLALTASGTPAYSPGFVSGLTLW